MHHFQIHHYIKEFLCTAAWLLASTLLGYSFYLMGFPETNIVIVYLLGVILSARYTDDMIFCLFSSIMATFAFNYFFTAPYYTLRVYDLSYLITFLIMTSASLATSTLTLRVKKSAAQAKELATQTQALYHLTNQLSDAKSMEDIAKFSAIILSDVSNCECRLVCYHDADLSDCFSVNCKQQEIHLTSLYDTSTILNQNNEHEQQVSTSNTYDIWMLTGREQTFGKVFIAKGKDPMNSSKYTLLSALVECTALAMDRFCATQERFRYQEESLQERYRGNLLRAISHDLRTPLSGIMGTCEIIMDMSTQNDPRFDLTKHIWEDADWLHSLVENILNLTRLQDGRLAIEKHKEAVEEIISSVCAHMMKRAPAYEINVSIPDELLFVPMDAKLIMQVLINLLDNAIKHSSTDHEIAIIVKRQELFAEFIVQDYGEGIALEDLPHIFDLFYTSKLKTVDAKRGIGLGLAICKTIVNAHDGDIWAENRECGGTRMVFTLPLEVVSHDRN